MKKRRFMGLLCAVAVAASTAFGTPVFADPVVGEGVTDVQPATTEGTDAEGTANAAAAENEAAGTTENAEDVNKADAVTDEAAPSATETMPAQTDAASTEGADTENDILVFEEENTLEGEEAALAGEEATPSIVYNTHVQNVGWQSDVSNGGLAGTSGRSLRLEGINIHITDDENLGVRYRTHVQNVGWQNWVSDGAMSGTSGRGYRLEAIQIELTGDDASKYDVYYCTHVQNDGWQNWVSNGAVAGTSGRGLRLEAIRIMLVKKGEQGPLYAGSTSTKVGHITYSSHVQNIGWQGAVSDGATTGTSGRSLRLEGLKINVSSEYSGGITYRTHVQNVGWQDWVSDGEMSGTSGRSLRLEAVQVKLTGELANHFDVYYRTHVQNMGWMGWAKNGESAGTEGWSYRMEAMQFKLVPKGEAAPSGSGAAFSKYVDQMWATAQGYSSPTNWLILVNRGTHKVNIYKGSKYNWTLQKSFDCCVGAPGTPTITGVYQVGVKGTYFVTGGSNRCWYYTQIKGNYLFHSVIYDGSSTPRRIVDGTMGQSVSHGCVRLDINNAKWIYDNIPTKSTIVIYN